ncbi:MAG: cytochrome c biogenesis protein CcsA [Chloroflexota bacterium]|nr:cytochrome c biogenesis protein CcsA [Chloroflexota bacterium]
MGTSTKRSVADTIWLILAVISAIMILIALYLSLIWAPEASNLPTETERLVQRVFYFHVSAGWVGFFAFMVTAVAGIIYLITKKRRWDFIALASVEIGVTFTTANVISGSIWAKPTWNTWWPWNDPRITSAAVVLLIYIAYLMLRNSIDDPERRARLAAVYGIIGFISVPITFLSIRWWRTIHPAVVGTGSDTSQGGFDMAPDMATALMFSVITFTLLYFVLLRLRVRLEDQREQVEDIKTRMLEE